MRLFLDVLAAVAHALAYLIVHRDIKPSNVLVAADAQVKPLDFGIAKLLEEEGDVGEVIGAHARPRRAIRPSTCAGVGRRQSVTTATDVYSLRTLLYLLSPAGVPPRSGAADARGTARVIVDTDPRRRVRLGQRDRTDGGAGRA